jgi:hypothetical protein
MSRSNRNNSKNKGRTTKRNLQEQNTIVNQTVDNILKAYEYQLKQNHEGKESRLAPMKPRDHYRAPFKHEGREHMSVLQRAMCRQIFAPGEGSRLPFVVLPSKGSLEGQWTEDNVLPPRKGIPFCETVENTIIASTAGNLCGNWSLTNVGYRSISSFLATDGGVFGATVPNGLGTGITAKQSNPKTPFSEPAHRNLSVACLLGARLTITANWTAVMDREGALCMAWVDSPINPLTGAVYSMDDLLGLGYPSYSLEMLDDGDEISCIRPSDAYGLNDREVGDAVIYSGNTREGYIVFVGTGLAAGSKFTVRLDTTFYVYGQGVDQTIPVFFSAEAANCADSCYVNAGLSGSATGTTKQAIDLASTVRKQSGLYATLNAVGNTAYKKGLDLLKTYAKDLGLGFLL